MSCKVDNPYLIIFKNYDIYILSNMWLDMAPKSDIEKAPCVHKRLEGVTSNNGHNRFNSQHNLESKILHDHLMNTIVFQYDNE